MWFLEFDGSACKPRLHRRHSLHNIPSNPSYYRLFLLQHGCSASVVWNPFASVAPAMSARPRYWNNPSALPWDTFQQTTQQSLRVKWIKGNEMNIESLACHGMWNQQSKVLGHKQMIQDRDAHFVGACEPASLRSRNTHGHVTIMREFLGKMLQTRSSKTRGTHTLCANLRSQNAHGHRTRAIMRESTE